MHAFRHAYTPSSFPCLTQEPGRSALAGGSLCPGGGGGLTSCPCEVGAKPFSQWLLPPGSHLQSQSSQALKPLLAVLERVPHSTYSTEDKFISTEAQLGSAPQSGDKVHNPACQAQELQPEDRWENQSNRSISSLCKAK